MSVITYDSWVNNWYDSLNDCHDNQMKTWLLLSYLQEISDEDLDGYHDYA